VGFPNLSEVRQCRKQHVPLSMTKPWSAFYFTSTPHYSTLNFTNVEDRWLLQNIVKNQLDIFGYSSVSELQSFPTLDARLLAFRHIVYRDRKVIKFCLFGFHLNCKQHVMPHQGIRTFVCKYCSVFFLCKNPINRWLSMKRSAQRSVFFCSQTWQIELQLRGFA